jgi:hypothetical protein
LVDNEASRGLLLRGKWGPLCPFSFSLDELAQDRDWRGAAKIGEMK